jgi:major inositol transporter-like SP family MFS transporter
VLWLLLSELYPLKVKGVAMGLGSATCWLFTYAGTQVFPFMNAGLGTGGSFYLFAGVCVLCVGWIAVYLPETKGRSLEEIEDDLRTSCGMPTAAVAAAALEAGTGDALPEGKGAFVALSGYLTRK